MRGRAENPGHSSAISGIINYAGAIVSPAWSTRANRPSQASMDCPTTIVRRTAAFQTNFSITLSTAALRLRECHPPGNIQSRSLLPRPGSWRRNRQPPVIRLELPVFSDGALHLFRRVLLDATYHARIEHLPVMIRTRSMPWHSDTNGKQPSFCRIHGTVFVR